MRAALGYLVGATVSLTGGIADLAYINLRLVPRVIATPVARPIDLPPPVPAPAPEPRAPPPPVEIVYQAAGVVRFKTNSAELDETARAEIYGAARRLLSDPALVVLAEGHADKRGPSELNQALSVQRAKAVAAGFEELGVEPGRIEARGYGEQMASKKWVLDRRVEISIGGPGS